MRTPPQARLLPDGHRLHLQDGPIDLIIGASGSPDAVQAAYRAAVRRFATVLDELCGELAQLRLPATPGSRRCLGQIARRMEAAVSPFAGQCFITPMAAVAGSVAEEILGVMREAAPLERAFVNNGGDIALHLASGASFAIGLVDRPDRPGLFGAATVRATDRVRGVATSGWRGRSHSLGIADAVTILARTAAMADAAATIVANAVDLQGHPRVCRRPAEALQPDSDLGARLVTVEVGALAPFEVEAALDAGAGCAANLVRTGLIETAALSLLGVTRVVGGPDANGIAAMGAGRPRSVGPGEGAACW